jgi:hypothetical protein
MKYWIDIRKCWLLIRVSISREDNRRFFEDVIRAVGDRLVGLMKENLEERDAIATGYLYNSFNVVVEGESGFVKNDAPYSLVLEVGCVPHRPPYDEILNWVYVKKKETGELAETSAWRIVRKIEREGYEGRFYAKDALREVVSRGGNL